MACTSGIWGAHRPGQTKFVKEVHLRQGREEPQLFDGPQLAGTEFLESGAHRPKHAKPLANVFLANIFLVNIFLAYPTKKTILTLPNMP